METIFAGDNFPHLVCMQRMEIGYCLPLCNVHAGLVRIFVTRMVVAGACAVWEPGCHVHDRASASRSLESYFVSLPALSTPDARSISAQRSETWQEAQPADRYCYTMVDFML